MKRVFASLPILPQKTPGPATGMNVSLQKVGRFRPKRRGRLGEPSLPKRFRGFPWGVLLLLLVASCPTAFSETAQPEFSGYVKDLFSVTDSHGTYEDLGLIDKSVLVDNYTRFRLKADYAPSDAWSAQTHYEIRLQWGDSVRLQRAAGAGGLSNLTFGDTGVFSARRRFMDLTDRTIDRGNLLINQGFDRLWVRYDKDYLLQLTVGRQAVSWGTGLIWTPTDLFAGFVPTEIDRDEKIGVDVVRLILHPGEGNLSFDVIAEPLDLDENWSVKKDDSSLAMRVGTHLGEYDLHACAGNIQSDKVVGADFSGYIKDAGFRGDFLYTWVDETDQRDYFRGVLSLDYSWALPMDPYVAVEYFYNGLGTQNEEDYLARLSESSVQRVFNRGIAFNYGRHYLGSIFRLQVNALTTVQAMTLWNLLDSSVREYATLSRSISDNIDLIFGANFGLGSPGGEFYGWSEEQAGQDLRSPDLYFVYLKWYF